jgi:hypothetical protein
MVVGCAAAPMRSQSVSEERAGAPTMMATQVAQAPMEEGESDAGSRGGDYADVERLIIRNATLDLVVRDTNAAVDEIDALAEELGGYVIESNISEYQEGQRAHLRIRIPAEDLDSALSRIRELAVEVRRESISGQDVTDEYVDLQSRLRHLQATEERLLTFMEEAEDTEAALEVFDRLQNIQAQIEQTRGRMQYLEQSAAMATITLDITPSELAQPIEVGRWRPKGTLRNAFESLIRVFQFLVDALIVIIVLIVPVLIIIALPLVGIFFLVRWIVRRRRRST